MVTAADFRGGTKDVRDLAKTVAAVGEAQKRAA
jgi:hypothetical protein